LVAGYGDVDTRKTADVLADWQFYEMSGKGFVIDFNQDIIEVDKTQPIEIPEPTRTTPVRARPVVPVSPVVPTREVVPVTEAICNGCVSGDTCLPFGTRLIQGEDPVFCSISGELEQQKDKEVSCQNSYECKTNQCGDNVCLSLAEELRETRGLLERIFSWLQSIFGE